MTIILVAHVKDWLIIASYTYVQNKLTFLMLLTFEKPLVTSYTNNVDAMIGQLNDKPAFQRDNHFS